MYQSLLQKVKEACKHADIISFDIFDTLLLRPYIRPTDLFLHLEYICNKPNFAISRIKAEEYARINIAPPPPLYRLYRQ